MKRFGKPSAISRTAFSMKLSALFMRNAKPKPRLLLDALRNLAGKKMWIESEGKRIMFQIGYNEKELNARAELLRRCGHEVISAADNEAAKRVLVSIHNVDVFVVGHTAPEQTREEMVDWLKASFPKVKIVALIPSANRQLPHADYNVVLNDSYEWSSLLAAATS